MALQLNVFQSFGDAHISYQMKSYKNLYTKCIKLERMMVQFLCTYLSRGSWNFVFSKIILIVISQNIVIGIAHKFLQKIYSIKKKHWYNQCVHTLLEGAAILFFQNSFDIVISRLIVIGIAQKLLQKIYSNRIKHWYNQCVHTLLEGAAILFFPKFF